ncbi:MAG TPA: exodeoxyribonuclease VII large subunit [Thermomicrobiales bacterium]|nr:exodeoxyribonuclease VII large subunit [Thermomicrobiales bacterium]
MLDTPRSVREITDHIRDLFEADPLLGDLWITGEVLESTVSRSGHVFFTLAGDDAQIRCVLFRMNALRQRSLPSSGSACVAHGRVEIYAGDGTYQFYVDLVEEAGIGLAALELELLRQQLEAEGLFSESRKRPLPANPSTIGVVTSATGAVWHDIQNVIRRRSPFVQLLMAPAAVQGNAAPESLYEALQALILDGRPEVIIIARGGGSASDLASFNDESLVRAVFAAPVPVVSAIGHETDWTLLDLVADLRAPTPSAAAELVTPSIEPQLDSLVAGLLLQSSRFERELASQTMDLERLSDRLDRVGPAARIRERRTTTLSRQLRLMELATQRSIEASERIATMQDSMIAMERRSSHHRQERFSHAADLLQALSPTKTMERGYAFVEHRESGRPLKAVAEISAGDQLRTRFLDGSIESTVTSVSTSTF